jgi:hypothetical protein
VIVAPKIVGVEQEENAAGRLVANALKLLGSGGLGEEKSGSGRVGRSKQ